MCAHTDVPPRTLVWRSVRDACAGTPSRPPPSGDYPCVNPCAWAGVSAYPIPREIQRPGARCARAPHARSAARGGVRHPPWGRKRATNHFSLGRTKCRGYAVARGRGAPGPGASSLRSRRTRRAPVGSVGESHRRELGVDLELAEDRLDLRADGRLRDEAAASDLTDLSARHQLGQHLGLSGRQQGEPRLDLAVELPVVAPAREQALPLLLGHRRKPVAQSRQGVEDLLQRERLRQDGHGPRRQSGADPDRIGVAGHRRRRVSGSDRRTIRSRPSPA